VLLSYAIAVAAILAWIALYLYWTAIRLDQLHARVDAAAGALEAQLRRRGTTAAEFAASAPLPADVVGGLRHSIVAAAQVVGLGSDRELAETEVTRALFRAADALAGRLGTAAEITTEMHDEALRASFARRFYNDTVRDALVVRDRRLVRWLRLAGHAPHPAYFEMEDAELPMVTISFASRPTIGA